MMDFREAHSLDGQHALITGGTRGLGFGIAQCLIASGARVTITGTGEAGVEAALARLGAAASGVVLDVSRHDTVAPAVDAILAKGDIDILVNNAGNTIKKPVDDMGIDEFYNVLDVHVGGAYAMVKAVLPHMSARGRGSIVFTASMASYLGIPLVIGYSAAKSAYVGMVRALSVELGGRGIRVNGVAPGWIDSDLFRNAQKGDPERYNRIISRIPGGEVGRAEDIGWAVAYLVSPAARYVNGHILDVDGGGLHAF